MDNLHELEEMYSKHNTVEVLEQIIEIYKHEIKESISNLKCMYECDEWLNHDTSFETLHINQCKESLKYYTNEYIALVYFLEEEAKLNNI